MSDPWSNPPGGGQQPPPPPSYGATPGAGPGGGGYAPTPAYTGPSAGAGQKTNTLAIVALVTGILGVVACGLCGIPSIAAIVCGILGRNQIKASNGLEKGDGMALAGIITGAVGILMGLGWVILSIAGGSISTY